MDGFGAFRIYLAIKQHFNSNYDYFKYHGKTRAVKETTFLARKDRFFFERIAKLYTKKEILEQYFVANFLHDPKGWVGNFTKENYLEAQKKQESLSYTVRKDLDFLLGKIDEPKDLFKKHRQLVIREYVNGNVALETLIVLDKFVHFSRIWNQEFDPIWEEVYKLMQNYEGFLKFDREKTKKVLIKAFS